MQPSEDTKKSLRILHVEPDAVVADEVCVFGISSMGADLDDRIFRLGAELERV